MKHFSGSEELRAHFRLIGQTLLRAEASYFWFGDLGRSIHEPNEQLSVFDYLKQEMVGIRTGDIELFRDDLQEILCSETGDKSLPEYLCLENSAHHLVGSARLLRAVNSPTRRIRAFLEVLEKEIRRRQGETDEGGIPIPSAISLNVSRS